MLADLEAQGYGYDALELWGVGYPGTDPVIPEFTEGATSTCLIDSIYEEESAYAIWSANRDDIYVIDADGVVRFYINVAFDSLYDEENAAELEAAVLELLR